MYKIIFSFVIIDKTFNNIISHQHIYILKKNLETLSQILNIISKMFNPITLIFKANHLEKEYWQQSYRSIRNEFLMLSIYLESVTLLVTLGNFYISQIELGIMHLGMALVLLIMLFIVQKYPGSVSIILPSLQIMIAFNFRIGMQQGFQTINQAYFYGGLAQFLHLGTKFNFPHKAVLFQGHGILWQGLILIPVLYLYLELNSNLNQKEILLNLQYTLCFVGSVMLKYMWEKNKRLQFIDQRENKKWLNLLETTLNNYIITVSYNSKRCQLEIIKVSSQTLQLFGVQTSDQIKLLMRQMILQKLLMNGISIPLNLEQYIIQQIKDRSKSKEIQEIQVMNKKLKKKYQIRIIHNYNCQQKHLILQIVKITDKNNIEKELQLRIQNYQQLLREVSKKLLQHLMKASNLNNQKMQTVIRCSMLNMSLNNNYLQKILKLHQIKLHEILKQIEQPLKKIYNNINIYDGITNEEDDAILVSQSSLIFMINTILDLFGQNYSSKINCYLDMYNKHQLAITIQLYEYNLKSNELLKLINKNEPYLRKTSDIQNTLLTLWDYYHFVCNLKLNYSYICLHQFVLLKILLLQFTTNGQIEVIQNVTSLQIVFTLQHVLVPQESMENNFNSQFQESENLLKYSRSQI
ncbi:hypothetical protein pb186bvf_017296 [Paramecium bursaria]